VGQGVIHVDLEKDNVVEKCKKLFNNTDIQYIFDSKLNPIDDVKGYLKNHNSIYVSAHCLVHDKGSKRDNRISDN